MSKHRPILTNEEELLLRKIDLSRTHQSDTDSHDVFKANQQPILALLSSLNERGGIPEHWIRYWTDPDYNPGRTKASRKEVFERNGCRDDNIYTHPNFIQHLRYLLFGNELPDAVSSAFEREVDDPQWVISSDAIVLGKHARRIVRENKMTGDQTAEEFFKLALEIGLDLDVALAVRRSVQQVR